MRGIGGLSCATGSLSSTSIGNGPGKTVGFMDSGPDLNYVDAAREDRDGKSTRRVLVEVERKLPLNAVREPVRQAGLGQRRLIRADHWTLTSDRNKSQMCAALIPKGRAASATVIE